MRKTFREATTTIAWQKQLRDRYNSEGVPPVPHLDVSRAIVRPVSRRLAEHIILKYEWLGTMSPTSYHFGIFFGEYCAGVSCVGGSACTAGTNVHLPFGIERDELLILARGACVHWSPKGTNSKLVSWTCKLLAKQRLGKLVIAYADTDAGEIGTIYQACNWIYIGRGESRRDGQIIAPNGRIYDIRNVSIWAKKSGVTWREQLDAMIDAGWRLQDANPKHRYVYILDKSDKALIERVESMRMPYPKRASTTSE